MKKLIFFIVSISSVICVNAQNPESLMEKANNLFVEGKYEQALEVYNSILNEGYESTDLYYNIGNTYYKQKGIAKAILNYERALLLDPNNEDVKYNLELCNRLVVDQIEILPVFFITAWVRSFRNLFSSNVWAYISMITFAIALIFISFYLYSKGVGFKKLSFWLGFVLVLLSLSSFIFSKSQKERIINGRTAIIISPSVTVKSAPDTSGTDLFVIHEGTKVIIEDKISDWSEIKLSDGSKGWLNKKDLEPI
ncbi:MAG: tetratricopeptide repeat protein [Bacteroidales bacterium]|nr:tetratricopeptide repeat protein [Bacteroidales bacterium]